MTEQLTGHSVPTMTEAALPRKQATEASETLGIGEASARVGLDPNTLRYYERRGVLPKPQRDRTGKRTYDTSAMHLIDVLIHLKNTGMPLAKIAEFTRLVACDPDGVPERLAILEEHRLGVEEHLRSWSASLELINQKIHDYRARLTT